MPRRPLLPTVLLVLLLCACGGPATTPAASCSSRPVPAPRVSAQGVSVTADRGRVDPGGSVLFTEVATGPETLHLDCTGPLSLIVADSNDVHVYSGTSAAVRQTQCGTLMLAAGQSATFTVTWPVDVTLPAGAYTVSLMLGDAPVLSVPLSVGAIPGC